MEKQNLFVQWLTVVFGSIYSLNFNQWISLCLVVTGFFTLLLNWYYKHQNLKLARREIGKPEL